MANRVLVSWQGGVKVPEGFDDNQIGKFVIKILKRLEIDHEEISLLFCNDMAIQQMNRDYRNIDAPTDILSFENGGSYTDDEGQWLQAGDIAISIETLPKNAEYFNVSENEELKRLLIHGVLHLNGYDHGEEHIELGVPPTDEMLVLQEKILSEFGDVKLI
ncbi:MAG: rRNA maturation RNase YbeY [Treponema sp.]|uniref:rRNA maturation RNase YbeY n=1 Tax=Treponema sp. TaxID=166 RepID=UPI0025D299ED|nr:rRNA maturation RNase YbeY [Treponema sp.]MBQ9281516.1 rRNA maturation RNase YbeY [Treponema sp.]